MAHGDNCRHLLGSLSEYVDGNLAGNLCEELEHHLASCENCRIVVDTLRKTVYLVHTNKEEPECPADVLERLYHSLDLDAYLNKTKG
jgi:anti-sigma factor RsiW